MNMENQNPQNDLVSLRLRLLDLQRVQSLTPESFGLYQQTILQLHQECERRKQSCFAQAEQLRKQAAGAESQGHAFSAMGSIVYSVVNGYIALEEKRIQEEQDRAREREEPESPKTPTSKAKARRKAAKLAVKQGTASGVANGDHKD